MGDRVLLSGAFDDFRSPEVRFLEEASKLGRVRVLLWSDALVRQFSGRSPKLPESERRYVLQGIRYVDEVVVVSALASPDVLLQDQLRDGPALWVLREGQRNDLKESFCARYHLRCHEVPEADLNVIPAEGAGAPVPDGSGSKRVIVTGCYDWLHSGHVRFFEEVSGYGDLYVVVGHDANIRSLKGEGHPLFAEQVRRYLVGSIRFVRQAIISSGWGWLDADPEVRRLRPDIYAVNEDGDKGGKREYCRERGIQYLVLRRVPAPGLPPRSSTQLRGY
jgi:cytidyltransferase-like protein